MSRAPSSRPKEGEPERKPAGPRTPYPVDRPGIGEQPGSAPDYLPGKPAEDLPSL